MSSIRQKGIMQPVSARREDNKIIFGNRRVLASIKLGNSRIPVIFEKGISDTELLIRNLEENIHHKSITSIEIGRIASLLTSDERQHKLTIGEVAVRVNVSENRVNSCLRIFELLLKKYWKNIKLLRNSRMRKYGDLPETIFKTIITLVQNYGRKFNSDEFDYIIKKIINEKITVTQINLLGWFLIQNASIEEAFNKLNSHTIRRVNIIVNSVQEKEAMKKENIKSSNAFYINLLKKYTPYKEMIW